jgi:hypothetical protein
MHKALNIPRMQAEPQRIVYLRIQAEAAHATVHGVWPSVKPQNDRTTPATGPRIDARNFSTSLWPCLLPKKKYCAEKRFLVTSNLRYMYGVLNVDEIKN